MFVENLFTFLSGCNTAAAERIYPARLPQGVELPAATYKIISNPGDHTHEGATGLGRPRIQLDCYADGYLDAVSLANEFEAALDGYQGAMGNMTAQASFVEDAGRDHYDPETGRHWVIMEIIVWHTP